MADDVNKPRGGGGGRVSGNLSAFEQAMRRFEQASRPGVLETRLKKVSEQIQSKMEDITKQINEQVIDLEEGLKQIAEVSKAGEAVGSRLAQERVGRQTRTRRTFEETIGRFAGERAAGGRIRAAGEDPAVFTQAAAQSNQKSFLQLQQEHQRSAERAQELRERMIELSQDPGAGRKSFEQLARGITHFEQQEAIAGEAMELQRRQGRGTRQRFVRGTNTAERIETQRRREAMFESVTEAGEVKRGELGRDLEAARDKFLETFKAWQEALESGTGNLEELSSAAESAEANLEDIEAVASRAGVTGGGGGGILDQIGEFFGGKLAAGVHVGAEVARGAGQLTRFLGGEFRVEETQTQLQAANFANRQFEDMISATRRRDVAAMRRLTAGYATVDEVAEEVRLAENVGFGLEAGADTAQRVVNTAQQAGTGQVRDFAAGTRETIVQGTRDLVRGTSGVVGEQRSMQMRQSALELFDSIQRVRNVNTQMLADVGFDLGLATRGAGGRRNQLMAGFEGDAFTQLAGVGISPEDAIALTRQGVQQMGAQFGGRRDIMRAGAAQQAGLLSADQFIQTAAEMTEVGGGSDQLEKIMRQAVAAGMDNSKNIQQMVSATIELSREAAMTGQDVTAGQSELLAHSIGAMENIAENQRAAVAANAAASAKTILGDRAYNLTTVFRESLTRQQFGDVDFQTKQRLMTMTDDEQAEIESRMRAFRQAAPENKGRARQRLEESILEAGVGRAFLEFNEEGQITGVNESAIEAQTRIMQRTVAARETRFGMQISDPEDRKVIEEVAAGERDFKDLTPEQKALVYETGVLNKNFGVLSRVAGIGKEAPEEKLPNKTGGAAGEAELERERAAMTAAKQIETAVKNFAGDSGKLSTALNQLNKDFQKIADSPAFHPQKMEENAQKAADTFRQPATDIKQAAGTFKEAVAKFAETVGADQELKELLKEKTNELKSQSTSNKRKPHPKFGM